jgi:hypothetical protein
VEHEELTARGFGMLLKTMRGVAIMVLRKDSVLIFCAMMIPCMECNGMEWRRIGGLADTTVGRWIF